MSNLSGRDKSSLETRATFLFLLTFVYFAPQFATVAWFTGDAYATIFTPVILPFVGWYGFRFPGFFLAVVLNYGGIAFLVPLYETHVAIRRRGRALRVAFITGLLEAALIAFAMQGMQYWLH